MGQGRSNMKKEDRQRKIEQLIKQQKISNQDNLIQALEDEGIHSTQATVSRDIREMKIIKQADTDGNTYYTLLKKDHSDPKQRIKETISDIVTNVTNVQFVNIVQTTPRNANVLAALIDDNEFPGVVGTLAGYDTVVLFSPNNETAQEVSRFFIANIGE